MTNKSNPQKAQTASQQIKKIEKKLAQIEEALLISDHNFNNLKSDIKELKGFMNGLITAGNQLVATGRNPRAYIESAINKMNPRNKAITAITALLVIVAIFYFISISK